jgi:hypothetical protein
VLAYDYPMLDVFVTILFLSLFVVWLFLLLRVIADLFRDPEQSGGGKAMWLIIIFVLPYIGVISYLAVHGKEMTLRSMEIDRRRAAVMRY